MAMAVTGEADRLLRFAARRLRMASVARPRQRHVELALDHRMDKFANSIAQTTFDGIKPVVEKIADHIGLTTVHVGRLLRRFRELEMVDIRSNEVVFLENVRLLEEIARPMQDLVGE
jgi:CRP-like cAMP-binding protein